jgi:acetylornithine/succinyldiaminopimelate/putrescine aminotransferase
MHVDPSPTLPLYGNPATEIVASRHYLLSNSTGRQHLDFVAGVWCANLGHNNPDIRAAGFVVGSSNRSLRFMPPLTIGQGDIEH